MGVGCKVVCVDMWVHECPDMTLDVIRKETPYKQTYLIKGLYEFTAGDINSDMLYIYNIETNDIKSDMLYLLYRNR